MENIPSCDEDLANAKVIIIDHSFIDMSFGESTPMLDTGKISPALESLAQRISRMLLNATNASVLLAACFHERYRIYNNIIDLNAAIDEARAAKKLLHNHHQRFSLTTMIVASLLTERYEACRDASDLHEAMNLNECLREDELPQLSLQKFRTRLSILAESTPPFPPYERHRFHGTLMPLKTVLCLLILEYLGLQYVTQEDAESTRLALHYLPQVSTLVLDNYPFETDFYACMLYFHLRLARESEFRDMDVLTQLGTKCLQKTLGNLTSSLRSALHDIAMVYANRFNEQGESEDDLEQTLLFARSVAIDDSNDDPEHPDRQELYAHHLLARYISHKDRLDLDRAIEYGNKSLRPSVQANFDIERYAARCNRMAQCLLYRLEESKMPDDLQEAFEYHITARHLITELDSGARVWTCVDDATVCLMCSAVQTDFRKAIEYGATFFSEFSFPANIRSKISTVLSLAYISRYKEDPTEAGLGSLELSINYSLHNSASSGSIKDIQDMILAYLCVARNNFYGDTADIDAAIEAFTNLYVTSIASKSWSQRGRFLGDLHCERYERLGNEEDLRQAISYYESVLRDCLTPLDHRLKAAISIASAYHRLSQEHPDDRIYIETSLKIANDCLASYDPKTHPISTLQSIKRSLFFSLLGRHMLTEGEAELEQLSELSSDILALQDDGRIIDCPVQLEVFRAFASFDPHVNVYHAHWQVLSKICNSEPFLLYLKKISSTDIAPFYKFNVARLYGGVALLTESPEGLEAYELYSSLLLRLLWIGDRVENKYHALHQLHIPSIVSQATSLALAHGSIRIAIEYYEQGLSVAFRQLLQLRSPVNKELRKSHPDLASRYEEIAKSILGHAQDTNMGNAKLIHHLGRDYHEIVADIQRRPGFEKMFTRTPYRLLAAASKDGPVIMLNQCTLQYMKGKPLRNTDAIILLGPDKDPIHIQLSNVNFHKLESLFDRLQNVLCDCHVIWRQRQDSVSSRQSRAGKLADIENEEEKINAKFEKILQELREYIVNPIFDVLSKNGTESGRIWWCPSGPFTRLPLHAAAPDCSYIQSYTHSLESLVQARNQLEESDHVSEVRMAAIGIEDYPLPHLSQLPSVPNELETIASLIQNQQMTVTELRNGDATVENVLNHLETSHIVHVACHGKRDPVNPLENGLYLHDGTLNLRRILMKDLHSARFMFLSACETASGKIEVANESAHLSGGFITAGFKGVIGTLWSIADSYAPDVAKGVYEEIISEDGLDVTRAAEGLQNTINRLRESGVPYQYWMPYIHVGV